MSEDFGQLQQIAAQQAQTISQLSKRVNDLENYLYAIVKSDRYVFTKTIQLWDGGKIQVGKTLGVQIATAATQKIGFFGATPVVQPPAITAPSGGATIDSQARTAINTIQSQLGNLGIFHI